MTGRALPRRAFLISAAAVVFGARIAHAKPRRRVRGGYLLGYQGGY